jgi:rRNA maturation endonuclease Nob1
VSRLKTQPARYIYTKHILPSDPLRGRERINLMSIYKREPQIFGAVKSHYTERHRKGHNCALHHTKEQDNTMRKAVTEDTLAWLNTAVSDGMHYSKMAAHVGCCTDTLKRILHRHGIVEFEGAKFQSRTIDNSLKWERPCMRCRDARPRPKWQYFCDRCTSQNERIQKDNASDEHSIIR